MRDRTIYPQDNEPTEFNLITSPHRNYEGGVRRLMSRYYTDLFQNVHFSNDVTTCDPNYPHLIGTDGKEMWENGAWSITWQVKGGEPVHGKGYHASVAVLEGGALKKRMLVTNVTPAPAATPSPTTTPSNQ
jgi:hypothetical protein